MLYNVKFLMHALTPLKPLGPQTSNLAQLLTALGKYRWGEGQDVFNIIKKKQI